MKLAYLTTAYPKVSHTFIRREITALERMGHDVLRLSVRGSGAGDVVDPLDQAEVGKTIYLLEQGAMRLLWSAFCVLISRPVLWFGALRITFQMARVSDRGLIKHLAYLVEACEVLRLLRQNQTEHLHVHFGTNATAVARLVKRLGGPGYSFTVHGPDELDSTIGLSLGAKIEDAAFVVAITSYCGAQLRRWVGYEHWDKIHIVHCGLDEAFFEEPTPIPSDSRTLVCVGRLCGQKGQLLLVDAMKRVIDRGINAKLVLAGDGEMRPIIEKHIVEHGLSDHVEITGWISNGQVREYLSDARAMVLPSFAEGLPVVIMEAFAMGRPVVSTYIAGIPELVKHGENGWLVPAGDVDALVEAMQEVLEMPIEKLNEMGLRGRESVKREHSIETEMKKLAGHFEMAVRETEGVNQG